MPRLKQFWFILGLATCLTGLASAETFQLDDGQVVTGEVVSPDEKGVRIRLPGGGFAEIKQQDGSRTQVIPWTKFSQEDLKLLATNPKTAKFAEPFIQAPSEKKTERPEIILNPVPRLLRPESCSLLKALFSSSVGLALVFALYLANVYAGFEIAIYREQPPLLACGLAAAVPIVGPILFFCLPKRLVAEPDAAHLESQAVPEQPITSDQKPPEEHHEASLKLVTSEDSETAQIPPTKIFSRGEFMFNRRFFETRFPGFFGIVRREADRDMVLIIKSARGQYVVQRITRISANDMHIQVASGPASQEVMIPFVEISEVIYKHKSAP